MKYEKWIRSVNICCRETKLWRYLFQNSVQKGLLNFMTYKNTVKNYYFLKVGCQILDPRRWLVGFADFYARSLWTRWRWILKSYQVMKGRIHLSHQYLGSLILGFSPKKIKEKYFRTSTYYDFEILPPFKHSVNHNRCMQLISRILCKAL